MNQNPEMCIQWEIITSLLPDLPSRKILETGHIRDCRDCRRAQETEADRTAARRQHTLSKARSNLNSAYLQQTDTAPRRSEFGPLSLAPPADMFYPEQQSKFKSAP